MLNGIKVKITTKDRAKLEAVVADRNSPQKHVWRARIILLTADGCGTAEIMRGSGTSKTAVWRWQERFMTEGVVGLLRDKTRPGRLAPLGAETEERVVHATLSGKPPGETTHWTAPAMAKVQNISVSSVQRIWRKHGINRTARATSSSPTTHSSLPNFVISSASTSARRRTPSCCRSTRRARFRRSTARSLACL
jgi:transposase